MYFYHKIVLILKELKTLKIRKRIYILFAVNCQPITRPNVGHTYKRQGLSHRSLHRLNAGWGLHMFSTGCEPCSTRSFYHDDDFLYR